MNTNFFCIFYERSKVWTKPTPLHSTGTQVPHDVHGLHDIIDHMPVPHKLLCWLPVDDFWLWDTGIPAKHASQ